MLSCFCWNLSQPLSRLSFRRFWTWKRSNCVSHIVKSTTSRTVFGCCIICSDIAQPYYWEGSKDISATKSRTFSRNTGSRSLFCALVFLLQHHASTFVVRSQQISDAEHNCIKLQTLKLLLRISVFLVQTWAKISQLESKGPRSSKHIFGFCVFVLQPCTAAFAAYSQEISDADQSCSFCIPWK